MSQGEGGGRPCKFQDLAELQDIIDRFFAACDEQGKPYTITGLALALDTSRETLMDIEAQRSEGYSIMFADTIKKAKLKCQQFAEQHMFTARNPAGAIFALKNYGWRDKFELSGDVSITQRQELSGLSDTELEQLHGLLAKGQAE